MTLFGRFRAGSPRRVDTPLGRSKWLRRFSAVVAALLLGTMACLLMLHLFRAEVVEQRLLDEARRLLPGSVTFGSVSLKHLPVPRVTIRHVQWQIPGRATLTMERLWLTARLLPLLRGKVEIASVQIERPTMYWLAPFAPALPPRLDGEVDETRGLDALPAILGALPSHLATAVAAMERAPSALQVVIRRGEFFVPAQEGASPRVHLRGVTARLDISSDQAKMDLSCSSANDETLSLKSQFDLRNLTGEVDLDFHKVQFHRLIPLVLPHHHGKLLDSEVNGRFSWKLDGPKSLSGSLTATLPRLVISTQQTPLELRGGHLAVQFHSQDNNLLLSLDSLVLEAPLLHASGFALLDHRTPQVQLGIQGWEVDASALRHAALSLMKDSLTTRQVFTIVQGGIVPWITWNAQAPTMAELANEKHHIVTGCMQHGTILVPNIDLLVSEAQGQVVITDGILYGEKLAGQTEGSLGSQGNLLVGLVGSNTPFHLDIHVDADLEELHEILTREIAHPGFHTEMDGITEIEGRATGRMVLGESTKNVNAWVDVSDFHLSALYQRIPHLVVIEGGRFYYGDNTVTVAQLGGRIGNSAFAGLNAWIGFKESPHLRVFSMKGEISLAEAHPWLMTYSRFKASFPELQTLQGLLSVGRVELDVLLNSTDSWPFQMEGRLEEVKIVSPRLSEPLAIDRGLVAYDGQQTTLRDCRIRLGDGVVEGSVQLRDTFSGATAIDFDGNGTLGLQSTRWIENSFDIPTALRLKTPLQLTDVHTKWSNQDHLRFSGTLHAPSGPQLVLALSLTPDELIIKDMRLQGSGSDAAVTVNRNHNAAELIYRGTATSEALNQVFESNPYLEGWIYGDGKIRLKSGQQTPDSIQGRFEVSRLTVPWWTPVPFRVESASLSCSGKEIQVDSATVTAQDNALQLVGKVGMDHPNYQLDLNLKSKSLDWNSLERLFDKTEENSDQAKSWDLPFRGKVRVEVDALHYGERIWGPLQATVGLHRDHINADIAHCMLCGILISGNMKRSSTGTRLNLQWNAEGQELDDSNDCLWERKGMVVGKYNLDGWLNAQGRQSALMSDSQGHLRFLAKDGRIYRLTVLTKILAILNVTEVLRGKLPDLATEGFAYESIEAYGDIRDGHLQLSQATIHGSAMKIIAQGDVDIVKEQLDLTVLVAPLKTADVLVSSIPLLGKLVTGKNATLLAFPFSVKGDLKDPDISAMPPTAMGSGLLDLLRKILP